MSNRRRSIRTPGWKAALAVAVAGGGLLWHVLACVESPMAFSPDGRKLAFVTREPLSEGMADPRPGQQSFRLFVLTDGRELRVLDESRTHLFSGPAVSPDGKRLAYVRVLIPKEPIKDEKDDEDGAGAGKAKGQATTAPDDLSLPPLEPVAKLAQMLETGAPLEAELVVRDLETGNVVRTHALDLVHLQEDYLGGPFYVYARPVWAPDGKHIYFCDGYRALRIDARTGQAVVLINGVHGFALSPDGAWLAALADEAVVFARADGQQTIYVRLDAEPVDWTLYWTDAKSVSLLTKAGVVRVQRDGRKTRQPVELDEKSLVQFAAAPDGSRWVLTGQPGLFLKPDGTVVAKMKQEEDVFVVCPVFRPDSKVVALKRVAPVKAGGKEKRTTHIVFFDADGRELSRVAIPPARTPATGQDDS